LIFVVKNNENQEKFRELNEKINKIEKSINISSKDSKKIRDLRNINYSDNKHLYSEKCHCCCSNEEGNSEEELNAVEENYKIRNEIKMSMITNK